MKKNKEWWLTDARKNKEMEEATKLNDKFYQTTKWRNLRQYVLALDEHRCAFCNNLILNSSELEVHHVHHINLSADGYRLRYTLFDDQGKRNLVIACVSCHSKITAQEQRLQASIPFDYLFFDPTAEFQIK